MPSARLCRCARVRAKRTAWSPSVAALCNGCSATSMRCVRSCSYPSKILAIYFCQLWRSLQSRCAQSQSGPIHPTSRYWPRRQLPSVPAYLRHSHVRKRRGHPLYPTATGPRKARDHSDLHRGQHPATARSPRQDAPSQAQISRLFTLFSRPSCLA